MIYEDGVGRVEKYSAIFNVKRLRRVPSDLLPTVYGIIDFYDKDGRIWLDTVDGYINMNIAGSKMMNRDQL